MRRGSSLLRIGRFALVTCFGRPNDGLSGLGNVLSCKPRPLAWAVGFSALGAWRSGRFKWKEEPGIRPFPVSPLLLFLPPSPLPRFAVPLILCLLGALALPLSAQEPFPVAKDGRDAAPIVIASDAGEDTRAHAAALAEILGRMTGREFMVTEGDGSNGIVVGTIEEFPELAAAVGLDPDPLKGREDYHLRSEAGRLLLIGATELAVSHAVWDLAHRLGYRQFFPGPTWEIVPELDEITVELDVAESPGFYQRALRFGGGYWDYNRGYYDDWRRKNRMAEGVAVRTTHEYQTIVATHREEFDANPEYYALVDGKREFRGDATKFNFANPGLRELVVRYAFDYFRKHPDRESLSMDPSDGGGYCESEESAALGSISDQVLGLANEVAEAVEAEFGPRFIGILAYGFYSPPPSIEVHPNVIVTAANGFLRGGYTFDEVVEGWAGKGATMGAYDYLSVYQWDRDLPGHARAGRPGYIQRFFPHLYKNNARFFVAEMGDNWGPFGLGYYLISRLLWSPRDAERIDALQDDFFEKAFGQAEAPMREFYGLVFTDNRPLLSEDLVGRMYRALDRARRDAAHDPAVLARIDDLVLYTRFVELAMHYRSATAEEAPAAFEEMMRHSFRMRETMMVHTKQHFVQLPRMERRFEIPPEMRLRGGRENNPLMQDDSEFAAAEIAAFISEGIENNPLLPFETVEFSEELVPIPEAFHANSTGGGTWGGFVTQRAHRFLTWIEPDEDALELEVRGGMIRHFRDRGNVKLALGAQQELTLETVARDDSVPPDGEPRAIRLATPHSGLHWVDVETGGDAANLEPADEGRTWCIKSSTDTPTSFAMNSTLYFYVPKGTKTIGGYSSSANGRIEDDEGNVVLEFSSINAPGYFNVEVPEGRDGSVWRMRNISGQRLLMTVPPYLARRASHLLVPSEVLEADLQ